MDAQSLAARWADLCPGGPSRSHTEVYAPAAIRFEIAHPEAQRLCDGLPFGEVGDRRVEIVNVVAADDTACVEALVSVPSTGEQCPACLWWVLDERGLIAQEGVWFDWDVRGCSRQGACATLPPDDGRRRGDADWYRRLVDAIHHLWVTDPEAMVDEFYSADCTMGRVGVNEIKGSAAIREAVSSLKASLPMATRWMRYEDVIAAGGRIALLLTIGDDVHRSSGATVMTLDSDDRVLSDRTYWDWANARPIHVANPDSRSRGGVPVRPSRGYRASRREGNV